MALNPSIILSGQSPDVIGSLSRGMATGQQANQIQQQNALANLYQTQGAGIAAGDKGALNALAGLDPMAALGVQSNRLGMDSQRLQMDATRQSMGLQAEAAKRAAAEYARGISAEQAAQESAKLEQGVAMALATRTPEEFDALMTAQGLTQLVGKFAEREVLAAQFMSVKEVLDMRAAHKPQSPLGKFEADRAAGLVPLTAEFKPEGNTSVTVNNGEGSKFYDELDKGQATMFQTLLNEGVQAGRTLQQVDRMAGMLDSVPTGGAAAFKTFLGEYGIPTEGLDDLQALQALINQIVPQQRQPGSGPMSDADLALFKQSVPRLINQPGGNKIIIDRMRAISQYQVQQAEIAAQVADRTITPADGRRALAALVNPLEGIQSNQAAKSTAQGAADFSAMALPDLIEADVTKMSIEELRAFNKRMKELGQ
jgi:hypothetical protein